MDRTRPNTAPGAREPRISLRFRLTLWVVAIFCLIQWITGGVFWLYQHAALDRVVDEGLGDRGAALRDEVAPLLPVIDSEEHVGLSRNILRHVELGNFYFEVFNADGVSVLDLPAGRIRPDQLPLERALESPDPIFEQIMLNLPDDQSTHAMQSRAVLLRVEDAEGNRYVVVLVTNNEYAQAQLALFGRVMLLAGVIGPIAAAISGWFIAGIAVAPLERVRRAAAHLGPESMGEEINLESSNTEVASLAEELNEARERIKSAFAAQERFLSNVSHEIKTPISVMLAEAETLHIRNDDPEVGEFVESVKEEMSRLGGMVESFLTLSRVRDGKELTKFRAYAVNDLIMDSIDRCLLMAEHHGVRLVPTVLSGDDSMDVKVHGDPELLRTMLDNLVRNAIRFSPDQGRIDIIPDRERDAITIAIQDEGPGIPPERIETIFDRFSHTESGHRKGRGHGLGLSIALGVAELHGGAITASNRGEGGCRFVIRLPIRPKMSSLSPTP